MTSVPKPLKFLRPHYSDLAIIQASWPEVMPHTTTVTATSVIASVVDAVGLGGVVVEKKEPLASEKSLFADILSVLAMTYSDTGKRETLSYRLKGGSQEDPGTWGHEYVRLVLFLSLSLIL